MNKGAAYRVQEIPAAIRAGADPNYPFGILGPTIANALRQPALLREILELGADPNLRSGRGYLVLLEALLVEADGWTMTGAVSALKGAGARWNLEPQVAVPGGEVELPIPLAFAHLASRRGVGALCQLGMWLYGSEMPKPDDRPHPSTIDRWGGNLAHHHIWAGLPHPEFGSISDLARLKLIRVDLHAKAELGSEDEIAWAKLTGSVPPFLGLSPVEFGKTYWAKGHLPGKWEDL